MGIGWLNFLKKPQEPIQHLEHLDTTKELVGLIIIIIIIIIFFLTFLKSHKNPFNTWNIWAQPSIEILWVVILRPQLILHPFLQLSYMANYDWLFITFT